jgi:hypothetical protein
MFPSGSSQGCNAEHFRTVEVRDWQGPASFPTASDCPLLGLWLAEAAWKPRMSPLAGPG